MSALPSLDGATGWLNTAPLTAAGLRGKVVLVNFWTYTCINWLRQLPHVRLWAERYAGAGLVVLGVHTPEFGFEHDVDNVRRAVKDMRVGWPVALDSDYAIWRAFGNHYWPALYLADREGQIRHHAFGEGDYEESETALRQLLGASADSFVVPDAPGLEAPADWESLRTAENYTGYGRTSRFASPGDLVPDRVHEYEAPDRLRLNHWALSGAWTVGEEASTANRAGGRLVYRFQVRLDGQPPGDAHGLDADADGNGTATEQRLHQLIRQPGRIVERTFEITFLDPGIGVYALTFG
jgi:thiol-disulfide isomerase/thioredoxin